LQDQIEQKDAQIAALRAATPEQDPALLLRLEAALAERDSLRRALDEAEEQLRLAGNPTALPKALGDELERLAASNAGLMTYDAERGKVQLRSDLTFGLGSAQVSSQASSSLSSLADVLNSSLASAYEVRVVGHTDNVPIRNARFKNNWELSTARAVEVVTTMTEAGMKAQNVAAAGYAEFDPVADNGSPEGRAQNRRIEIILMPKLGEIPGMKEMLTGS